MKPTLFAPAPAVQAIRDARAIAVLIGGYDGSGNYGDIALLETALDLVERLEPGLLVLPLLERSRREDHRELVARGGTRSSQPIFFDPEGNLDDDLLPLAAPTELAFGACYLYGGGYLNRFWGDRKLAMLRGAEALLEAGGAASPYRVSSGLQVEADWIAGLEEEDASVLRSFDFLGVRDDDSGAALERVAREPAVNTGDDAVVTLDMLPKTSPRRAEDEPLRINVHFAEHDWVSEHPERVLGLYAGCVAELGRLAGGTIAVRPLIAYLDRDTDERAAAQRLADACAELGAEVAEPLVLNPTSLAETAPRLSEADLTLSCSYHVALTSLMSGVPATLLGDSPYYAQKAAGLAEDFELPDGFAIAADSDPVASARELAEILLDRDNAFALRRRLEARASWLHKRRSEAEVTLLGRLGGAAATALGQRIDDLTERLRHRSAEPVELHGRLAELQTELEELRHETGKSPLDAELRAQEAENDAAAAQEVLAEVVESRSWRLAAPLRRVGAALRRG